MRCIFCNRPLTRATVMLGGQPVGPDCAKKHNLLGPTVKSKRIERLPRPPAQPKTCRDRHTVDLFDDYGGSIAAPDGARMA